MSAAQAQRRPCFKPTRKQNRAPPPTHFIAVPLNTNPALRARVAAFQAGLFKPAFNPDGTRKTPIRGLDRSVVIDPIRFHLTLGVMALAEEKEMQGSSASATSNMSPPSSNAPTSHGTSSNSESTSTSNPISSSASPLLPPSLIPTSPSFFPHNGTSRQKTPRRQRQPLASTPTPPQPLRTVRNALALLRSLKPQIDAILNGGSSPARQSPEATIAEAVAATAVDNERRHGPGLEVVLEALDIMRPVKPKVPKLRRPREPNNTKMATMEAKTGRSVDEVEAIEAKTGDEEMEMETAELDAESEETAAVPGPSAVRDDVPLSPELTNADASANYEDTPDPDDVWADVMYLAPRETGEDGVKLRRIANLVNSTFRREGYSTERRPLKLHCTVLNTSKRRPARARGQPFSYSDLLHSDALRLLGASRTLSDAIPPAATSLEVEVPTTTAAVSAGATSVTSAYSTTAIMTTTTTRTIVPSAPVRPNPRLRRAPGPVPISLNPDGGGNAMTVRAHELGLWIMGSRGPRGEYVSCGDVPFGG